MTDVITKYLDVWTSAIASKATAGRGTCDKQTSYGIRKLRELILELAVRGKLVPQDPNDGPASVLLNEIDNKRQELIKEGKIKKYIPPDVTPNQDVPFILPNGWQWAQLNRLGFTQTGGTPSKSNQDFFGNDFPFIKPGDIYSEKIDYQNEGLTKKGTESLGRIAPAGSILMVCIGTIGKCNSIDRDCCFNQQINSISPFADITGFTLIALRSNYFQIEAWSRSSSTTIAILNKGNWEAILVPLPPLNEQHRIVAKVDELMALCDQLEQQQTDNIAAHQTLVQTLLNTLTQAADAAEFEQAWSHIADHFDTLFTTESSIDQLKQTLLQLAVMGKLVPQDPNDESAKTTLQKIIIEKELLMKAKKFQNTAKLKPKNNSLSFPKSWEYVQIGEVCPSIVPNRDKPKSFGGSIPWVTLASFPENGFYLDHSSIELGLTQEEVETYSARLIPENTVLMSCVGRFGLTAINKVPVVPNQQIHAFVILQGLVPEYLSIVIKVAANQLEDIATTTTIAYLNKTNCESIEFGFPPTAEQIRIVAKIEELMALCGALKARIAAAQTTQIHLADAIVEQAVA